MRSPCHPLIVIFIGSTFALACKKSEEEEPPIEPEITVTDVDGNVYHTLTIGSLRWMKENLRTTRYANGDTIPMLQDPLLWGATTEGATCAYANDSSNAATYGLLYNYYATRDSRSLCPNGWQVPPDYFWQDLELSLGVPSSQINLFSERGIWYNAGDKMKIDGPWSLSFPGITNASGFSALPAGGRRGDGLFGGLGSSAALWSTLLLPIDRIFYRSLYEAHTGIFRDTLNTNLPFFDQNMGMSCRCAQPL